MSNATVRLDEPHIIRRAKPKTVKATKAKAKMDTKLFKEVFGVSYTVWKNGNMKPTIPPYAERSEKARQKIIETIRKWRMTSPKFRKKESELARIRYAKRIGKTKTCSKCNEEKYYVEFDRKWDKNRSRRTLRSYCKACRSVMNKEYQLKRKEKL